MKKLNIEKVNNPPGVKMFYKEEAARGTRMLFENGFSPSGDAGDVSVRDPETGYIYISGSPRMRPEPYKNLGEYRAADMAVLDIDGNILVPWASPTIEAPMHLAIFRARPEVNAIVHTHSIWSSAYSICGKSIPLVLAEQQVHLGGEVDCAKYGPVGTDELGDFVVNVLGKDKNAALMQNHGAVTTGKDLDEAFKNAFFLEAVAQKAWLAQMLGGINTITSEIVFGDGVL